jgi:hypothetical protein
MVGIGGDSFRISSRGWTPRGHRIWAVFSQEYPEQVAIIAARPRPTPPRHAPQRQYHNNDEFLRCYEVLHRLPWESVDHDDPLQLGIMKRRYPQEAP